MFPLIARWVPATGLLFVLLAILAFILEGDLPGENAADSEWTSHYADEDNRRWEQFSLIVLGVAGLCFLQFLGSLRGALARAEGEPARITTAAIASGTAFITLLLVSQVMRTGVSWAASFYDDQLTVDANVARVFDMLSYASWIVAAFAAASMALAVATLAFYARVFPMWVAWLSALAVLAGLLGFMVFPGIVILAWIAVLSVYLLLPQRTSPPEAAATPAA